MEAAELSLSIAAILPTVLEFAVIIAVIMILDWLWYFIEPYAKQIINMIVDRISRIRRIEETIAASLAFSKE